MQLPKIKIIFAALSLCLMAVTESRAQDEKSLPFDERDWDWMNRHYKQVLDEVLPLEQKPGYVVSFRMHREVHTDAPEYSFSFIKDYQGNPIEVIVRAADTASLYDQLMALHRKDPAESIERIKKRLKFKEWRLTERNCPAVAGMFERYKKLSFSVPPSGSVVILHPVIHSFWINGDTARMRLEIYDEEHPLIVWAKEARRLLEACAPNKNS
ncbi:MAG: hypothetical protein L0229_25955 [Blastocatellia bacterium]|nr:hypothetical protein [Blastocatellia bacterium]